MKLLIRATVLSAARVQVTTAKKSHHGEMSFTFISQIANKLVMKENGQPLPK